jgi:hypothetical protein
VVEECARLVDCPRYCGRKDCAWCIAAKRIRALATQPVAVPTGPTLDEVKRLLGEAYCDAINGSYRAPLSWIDLCAPLFPGEAGRIRAATPAPASRDSTRGTAPKCECDEHDTPCWRTADYLVTRNGKRLAVCDRCTLPGDGTDDRDLNPDWSKHRPTPPSTRGTCERCGGSQALCIGCGKATERWKDDVSHPNLDEMKAKVPCSFSPSYGWYWCKQTGNLLGREQTARPCPDCATPHQTTEKQP